MKKLMLILIINSLFMGCSIVYNFTDYRKDNKVEKPEEVTTPTIPDVKTPDLPNVTKPTVYLMGMSEEEFKKKNDALKLFDENEDGIVYTRKECSDCNQQYYTFMYGKLEAVTPFHGGLNKMKFDITPPAKDAPPDSTETNQP